MSPNRPVLLTLLLSGSLLATGCGQNPEETPEARGLTAPTVREVEEPEPRLAVSYDGGVLVLRAADGEVLADVEVPGYVRLSPAGDDRHVMVTREGGWTALDVGAWTADHGDHGHSWTREPELTDFEVAGSEPGHVVPHDGITALFDDGTGTVTWFEPHDLTDAEELPATDSWQTEDPHHGVAVRVHDRWVHTEGTTESRSTVAVSDESGEVVASTDDCPGVHGEASAQGAVVVGCEDGVVVVTGDELTKAASPDRYGRIGNQAGSEASPYVLGDYKTDPDAELERPTTVSVVDTRDASIRLVELDASYSFRSLGRTPRGDGLVLGTDGALHVVDVRRARVTRTIPVTDPWREPLDWQQPRPTLEVLDGTAFVTDPAQRSLHVVDLRSGDVETHELSVVPDELVAVTG